MKPVLIACWLAGCAASVPSNPTSGGLDAATLPTADAEPNLPEAPPPIANSGLASTVILDSDGPGGVETYALIRSVFGPDAIEAPDLYANNHPGSPHLREDRDEVVGNHFVFLIHRDSDWDRDTYPATSDRQRNEIKTYEGSAENLKAREGETFLLTWKFRINPAMPVSKNFTHFFQLKGVGGDEQQPLITFTGAKKSGVDVFEVRYSPASGSADQFLATLPWTTVRGQWIAATVQATFGQAGALSVRLLGEDGVVVLALDRTGIDLWREGSFIRPKWGIYRSLADATNLRADEEDVRFQRFTISKLVATPQ
jgi:hypothetical protein